MSYVNNQTNTHQNYSFIARKRAKKERISIMKHNGKQLDCMKVWSVLYVMCHPPKINKIEFKRKFKKFFAPVAFNHFEYARAPPHIFPIHSAKDGKKSGK